MKRNLLKTMLVGVGLLAGTSMWAADATTLYERGTTGYEWTTDNLSDFSSNLTLSDYGAYYTVTKPGSSHEFSKTIEPTANAIINVDAYWYGMSNTSRYFSSGNGVYFRFGNIFVAENDQDQKHGYGLNGISNMSSVNTFTGTNGYRSYDITAKKFLHIEIEINTASNTLNYLRISEDGSSTFLVNVTDQTLESPDYTTIAFGFQRGGSYRDGIAMHEYLKSVKVTETLQDVTMADYTINYTCDNQTVSSTTGNIAVGTEITAESVVTDAEGVKYLIVADDVPSLTVSETATANVLEVPVRKPYTATVSVTTEIAGTASEPVVTTFTETDDKVCTWSYSYPMYVEQDGVYYKADETNSFGESGTFTDGQAIEKTVSYSTADDDVVYFSEAEALSTTDVPTTNDFSLSNGSAAAAPSSKGVSLGTIPAGTYEVSTVITANANRTFTLHDGSNTDKTQNLFSSNTIGTASGTFTLSSASELIVSGYTNNSTYNQSARFDYVLIKKATITESITVTSAGFATYCSTNALDFSSSTIKAYTASVSNGVATMTQIDQVPANTGVMLYSANGATKEDIPVIAGATAVESNAFVGVTSETTIYATDESTSAANYVLASQDGTVGFFKAATEGTTVPANKAYLQVAASQDSGAKSITISFGDDTNGINNIKTVNTKSDAVYNLNGQRVAQPQKGLYIVNGKKVILK